MFQIFLFSTLIFFVFGYKKIICDSKIDVEIEKYGFYFIESPNFPTNMTENMKENCVINATSKEASLAFVITNGYLNNVEFFEFNGSLFIENLTTSDYTFIYAANGSQLLFKFTNFFSSKWNAFQGYILHRNPRQSCLMMDQGNAEKPFILSDLNEIVSIALLEEIGECEWHFKGPPKGYGFKIVLQSFFIENMDLLATNSSDYPILGASNYNQTQPWAYYNQDNYLIVYFTQRYINFDTRFLAYITLVKNQWDKSRDECIYEEYNNNTAIWKIQNYPINSQCHLQITVFPKTQIVAIFSMFNIETNIDQINVYFPNGTIIMITEDMENIAIFEPFIDSEAIYKGEFLSDGSVRNGGFEIFFQTIECICAGSQIIVECNEPKIHYILNETTEWYCQNMTCNFYISIDPVCSDKQILFTAHHTTDNSNFEYEIYTNDAKFFDSNNLDFGDYAYYDPQNDMIDITFVIDSTKKIELIFSSITANRRPFYFALSDVETPKNDANFVISLENPSMTYNFFLMKENSFVSFQLSEELNSDILEAFTTTPNNLECFILYTDSNKTEVLTFFNKIHLYFSPVRFPYSYVPKSKSFAIYRPPGCKTPGAFAFIRAKNAHTKNCYFKNNVFYYSYTDIPQIITATAKETGNCEITILTSIDNSGNFYNGRQVILSLWTTAADSNVTIFSNTNETQTFITFNKKTSKLYQNIILGAPIYTIKIPASSSIAIDYHMIDTQNVTKIFAFNSLPFKAFVDTPFFGMPNTAPINYGLLGIYEIRNFVAEFVVDFFDLSSNGQLYLINSKNNISTRLTYAGQKALCRNSQIEIYYFEPKVGHIGARISISSA